MARPQKKDTQAKQTLGQYWLSELQSSKKEFERWVERAKKIVRRYRDERDAGDNAKRKFNILWSNVQVLKPALYGRMPKPEVTRRFKDQDPVGRAASTMLERCLEYEVEQYKDFDKAMKYCVEDRLLPGRGTAWIRYAPTIEESVTVTDNVTEKLAYECAPIDYVYWKDFGHSPARTWDEVWYVYRWVYMTREEGRARFGAIFDTVPLQHEEEEGDKKENKGQNAKTKAKVAEIWDKTEKKVIWIAKGFDKELDVRDDPLQLEGFFPCPEPLYATTTTGTLIPVPDYAEYQDQAVELDVQTQRIAMLTQALKVAGVYNSEYPGIKRLLSEGVDNTLIPVDAWAAFAEKGGMEGALQLLPIKEIIEVLATLYEVRQQTLTVIYETMGISDIIRGSSDAGETLGAQQLKAQFGSMRLRSSQGDVARFATDILRLKAQIITKFYSDETIMNMSGIEHTQDAQLAPQALQLLRQGELKDFRIEVAADTLAQIDEQKEKQETAEFITSIGQILKEGLPVVQAAPPMLPFLGELLLLATRKQRAGRGVEAVLEQCIQQTQQMMSQPQPNPEAEAEKAKAEAEVQKAGLQVQVAQQKAQIDERKMQAQEQHDTNQLQIDQQRMVMEAQNDAQRASQEQQQAEQKMAIEGRQMERQAQYDEQAMERDAQHQAQVLAMKRKQQSQGPKK